MRKSSVAVSRRGGLCLLCAAGLVFACHSRPSDGDEGGWCLTGLSGTLYCNDALLCNNHTCERPHVQPEGGTCTQDINCLEGLICNLGAAADGEGDCEPPHARGIGEWCSSDENCAQGNFCYQTCFSPDPLGADGGRDGGDATVDGGIDDASD